MSIMSMLSLLAAGFAAESKPRVDRIAELEAEVAALKLDLAAVAELEARVAALRVDLAAARDLAVHWAQQVYQGHQQRQYACAAQPEICNCTPSRSEVWAARRWRSEVWAARR